MGSKIGRFRKLEPGDASASEPHVAQDSSNANPTESQILNEQELQDILHSDTVVVSDPSSNNGQGDSDTFDLTDTFVSYNELTTTLKARNTTSRVQREVEAQEREDPETFGVTSGVKVYPFVKTRVSWIQRVSSWFRRN